MVLIREDLLEKLNGKCFYLSLIEYLNKYDKIQHANFYWNKEHPNEDFDPNLMKVYAKQFPVGDIKKDIHAFVKSFSEDLMSIPEIDEIKIDISTEFGFSDYMYIDFRKPDDPDLDGFYESNKNLYTHVKVRFSDHKEPKGVDLRKKATININLHNRTFISASKEMRTMIIKYIKSLIEKENEFLNSLKNGGEGYV